MGRSDVASAATTATRIRAVPALKSCPICASRKLMKAAMTDFEVCGKTCACVHFDAYDCARIRCNPMWQPVDFDDACECCCHISTELDDDGR